MITPNRPTLVIFQGGALHSTSPLAQLVADAQRAATLDLLQLAATADAFESAILVTEDPTLAAEALTQASLWDMSLLVHGETRAGPEFHFGESLRAVCESYSLQRVVYVGGSAMPLASGEALRDLALSVSGEGECVTANNLYSADAVAFWPASALNRIALPKADNDLAWLLHFRAGLPFAPQPRTLANQFDIDTPTDLAALWWYMNAPTPTVGVNLQGVLRRVPEIMPELARTVEHAYRVMATRRAEVLVAGRVSSWVWRRLETNLPCQTRIVSEERGMRASGREERGEARSILGLHADAVGIPGLIGALEGICNAAFLDTRVLFAHRALSVSPQDRFASDALQPETVSDPWVREWTEAMAGAKIPIVAGGHSLISGGVWALSEMVRASGAKG